MKEMIDGTDCDVIPVHGCAYGLLSRHGKEDLPIKKPWQFVAWNIKDAMRLRKVCSGDHKHVPCEGRDTKITETYTPQLCKAIMDAYMRVSERRSPDDPRRSKDSWHSH